MMDRLVVVVAVILFCIFLGLPIWNVIQTAKYREECEKHGGDRVTVCTLPGDAIRSCWDEKSGRRIFLPSE